MAKGLYHKWITEDGLKLLSGWARDGYTDEQIAKRIGISCKTLYEWYNKFSEIREAVKKDAKELADYDVEDALIKSAKGHYAIERTWERQYNKATGQFELVEVKREEKYIPPNPTSMIYFLKNRKPDKWRDRITVTDETAIEKLDEMIKDIDQLAKKGGGA